VGLRSSYYPGFTPSARVAYLNLSVYQFNLNCLYFTVRFNRGPYFKGHFLQ